MEARNMLTEAQSIHDQSYVSALSKKWSPLLEGVKGDHARNVMAVLFENQSQYLQGLNEETRSTNVGSFLKFVFPILRRVWPNLIANEIVSIQPMTAPVGGIFYYELKYGTTKGKVTAGQNLIQNFNRFYSSEKIDAEVIGTGAGTSFSSTLDFTPVRAGTVKVTAGSVTGVDNGSGVITGVGISSGTINYTTGAIAVTFASAVSAGVDVNAEYEYNMECNTNVPQVNIDISLMEIKATTRKLKALWCSEAADDLKAFHGIDAEAEVVAGIAAEIALELDREIIEELRVGGTGYVSPSPFNLNAPLSGGQTRLDLTRDLVTELTKASNRIHKATLRGPANFMVTSPEVSAFIEQLETHGDFRPLYNAATQGTRDPVEGPLTFGVYKVGTLSSKYVMYKDPFYPVTNPGSGSGTGDILMGYKGNTFIDAGYVWAPYVPLQVTATFLDPNDFQFRKGLRTRYAKKLVRSEFYGRVLVSGL